MKTSITTAEHYTWGEHCDGWHLLKTDSLSVIHEKMPPGSSEALHFHKEAQQFFFIIKGAATFELDEKIINVNSNEGLHIKPKQIHRISNQGSEDLIFLVISEPKSHGDRTNC